MNNKPNTDFTEIKHQIRNLTNQYADFSLKEEHPDLEKLQRLKGLLERISLGIYRIVVMGEIKKGKSSFINALLGEEDILPTASDVATSTVYKVLYGSEKAYTVFFEAEKDNPSKRPPPQQITVDQLSEYGTEYGNPDNKKKVDFIAIEIPNPILKQGVVIVDTPGVGGLFKKHRDITFRYAPNADAIFFTLDSVESVISADEIKFLKELHKVTKQVFFIQTKIDNAGEEQWRTWRERNLDILSKELNIPKNRIPYFPVSSKLKFFADEDKAGDDLTDSGFIPLLSFLHNKLIPAKDKRIALQAVKYLKSEVSADGKRLQDQLKISQETNKEKLAEAEDALKEMQEKVRDWETGIFQKNVRKFQEDITDLKDNFQDKIQEMFDPYKPRFKGMIENIRQQFKTPEEVYDSSNSILNDYAADSSYEGEAMLKEFQEEFRTIYNDMIKDSGNSLAALIQTDNLEIHKGEIHGKDGGKMDALTSGFMKGRMIDGIGGMLTIGALLINPWFGVAVGTVALGAALFGGFKGYKSVREKKLEEALIKLERELIGISQNALKEVLRFVKKTSKLLERDAKSAFEQIAQGTQDELKTRLQEVKEARKRTAEETKSAIGQLKPKLDEIIKIDQGINTVMKKLSQ